MDSKTVSTAIDVAMGVFANLPKIIAAIEGPGHGVEKAQYVTNAVAGTLNSLPQEIKDKLHVPGIIGAANLLTDTAVAIKNLSGEFRTNNSQPIALPAVPIEDSFTTLNTGPKIGAPIGSVQLSSNPVPSPAPLPQSASVLRLHIEHMQKRLVDFQAGSAPDKESRIANLQKNIAESRAELASLE